MSPAPDKARFVSFVVLGDRLGALTRVLSLVFTHPWVASYQVGFGPPLIDATEGLRTRLKYASSALDKLRAYLEVCLYDDAVRTQLASRQRRLLTRRYGPLEAETVRQASANVLDLSLRLHHPDRAPPAVAEDMLASGVVPSDLDRDAPPDAQAARFWVHLDDPRNTRLLHSEDVAAAVEDPESALAVELRVPVELQGFFRIFCQVLARDAELVTIDLGEPRSVARVSRDGHRT